MRYSGMHSSFCQLGMAGVVLAWLLASSALAQPAPPASPAPVPTTKLAAAPTSAVPLASCVTSQCHADVKDYKIVHGPVNVNACDACHKLSDEKNHKFVLARPKEQICTFCHKMELSAPVVHKPVQTGDCLPCHNPHGGNTNKTLRSGPMNQVCSQCHKDVVGDKKMVHGPVAAGACEACHQPHAGQFPKLLVAEGKELCFSCHKEMSDQMKKVQTVHKPVADGDCSQCHDPHASDYPKQIKAPALELCTNCHEHEKIKVKATESTHKHSVVTDKQACLNCHTAHGGSVAKLMKAQPLNVCLNCHDKPIKTAQGQVVASVIEVKDPAQTKHGPIQNGNCSGCHEVHGSEVSRLLAKPYPEVFYQPFLVDKYDLCFGCHDQQLVLMEQTKGLTNFRNGDRNLHFVHVNKADKGRSCRACHETHASRQPFHIRDSVPYGNWRLPINYTKTDTGGSCSPGCHKPFTYDRVRPQIPVTLPVAPSDPATPATPAGPTASIPN